MSKLLYERLAQTPGVNARLVSKLLDSGLSLSDLEKKLKPVKLESANRSDYCTPSCADYPKGLRQLADPPLQLFYRGAIADGHDKPIVAVVGSRKATSFGLDWAHRLGLALARRGVAVCSGLASGIDAEVHRAVVKEGARNSNAGMPIAVLAHGWDHMYPRENTRLAREIAQQGVLLTEYSASTRASRWSFPARNRIIAGLSEHVIVVEAGLKSGSLYTAEFALELGRSVWIIPNCPGRPNSAGVLGLWQSGANLILDAEEFAETIAPTRLNSNSESQTNTIIDLESEERLFLKAFVEANQDLTVLCQQSSYSPTEMAYHLACLEMVDLIKRDEHGQWELKNWDLVSHLLK